MNMSGPPRRLVGSSPGLDTEQGSESEDPSWEEAATEDPLTYSLIPQNTDVVARME